MQVLGLLGGGYVLMAKIDEARLQELDEFLKGQSELFSEALLNDENRLDLPQKTELFRDLEKDPRVYFQLDNLSGEQIYSSLGQVKEKRAELADKLKSSSAALNRAFDLPAEDEQWRAIRTEVEYPSADGSVKLILQTALNETQSIEELDRIRALVFAGAMGLSVLTSILTATIVLLTTTNLRLFAKTLSKIDPVDPRWDFPIHARSAEEGLLFTSFDQMMQNLLKARQAQKLFIANASHELKTPVAGMMAALEVLLSRERTAADFQAVNRELLKSVRHMKRLTSALLDTSILDINKALTFQTLDLRELVDTVVERWTPLANEKKIEILYQRSSEITNIGAHPELLDVAISNLLDNAIKYSHESSQITVEVSKRANTVQLTIRDQGLGMDEQTRQHLGQIFFRGDLARSQRDSFGLGFANAKRIIENHAARLNVESKRNEGTTVELIFSALNSQ